MTRIADIGPFFALLFLAQVAFGNGETLLALHSTRDCSPQRPVLMWPPTASQSNELHQCFSNLPLSAPIQSLKVAKLAAGCQVTVYSGSDCSYHPRQLFLGECFSYPGDLTIQSVTLFNCNDDIPLSASTPSATLSGTPTGTTSTSTASSVNTAAPPKKHSGGGGGGSSLAIILGPAIGAPVAVVLAGIVAFLCYRKRRHRGKAQREISTTEVGRNNRGAPVSEPRRQAKVEQPAQEMLSREDSSSVHELEGEKNAFERSTDV